MGLTIPEEQDIIIANAAAESSVTPGVKRTSSSPNSVHEKQSNPQATREIQGYSVERTANGTDNTTVSEGYILQRLDNILHGKLNKKPGQEDKINMLQGITGLNYNEILKMNPDKIDKILNYVVLAVTKCRGQNIDINYITKTANKYYIAIELGQWNSVEQFERAQRNNHESLNQRLKRTGQTLDQYMRSQFGADRSLTTKGKDYIKAKKAGMSVEDYKSKQAMQDLSKMLINSSKEEKFAMVGAMKHLSQSENIDENNRVNFYKMIYASLSPAEQMEFADTYAEDKEILRIVGADANFATIQGATHLTSKHASENGAIRLNKSIDRTAKAIETRIAELESKQNLTGAEQTELDSLRSTLENQYTAMMVGNTTGSEANVNIVTPGVLEEIIANNTSHTNRNEVMAYVAEYTLTHSEEMRHTQEEFRAIMDSVTNGEYSNIENSVRESLNINSEASANSQNTNKTTAEGSQTQALKTIETAQNVCEDIGGQTNLYTQASNYKATYSTNPFERRDEQNIKSETSATLNTTITNSETERENGIVERIKNALKEENKGSAKWQNAINEYERSSSDMQFKILSSGLDVETFKELIKHSSIPALEKFINSGEKGPDFDCTKAIEEELQELRKQQLN